VLGLIQLDRFIYNFNKIKIAKFQLKSMNMASSLVSTDSRCRTN